MKIIEEEKLDEQDEVVNLASEGRKDGDEEMMDSAEEEYPAREEYFKAIIKEAIIYLNLDDKELAQRLDFMDIDGAEKDILDDISLNLRYIDINDDIDFIRNYLWINLSLEANIMVTFGRQVMYQIMVAIA